MRNPSAAPALARELDAPCAANTADACAALGALLVQGAGVPRDPQRAIRILEPLCAANDLGSCGWLGVVLADRHGVGDDDTRAATLFRRACDEGIAHQGCDRLGRMFLAGRGVVPSDERARELSTAAC
ncbi:MAG: hypothetical protein WCJ30_05670, partial [Deltaproteobacteria bacterium]